MDRFLQHIRAKPCPRACRTNITGGTYIGGRSFPAPASSLFHVCVCAGLSARGNAARRRAARWAQGRTQNRRGRGALRPFSRLARSRRKGLSYVCGPGCGPRAGPHARRRIWQIRRCRFRAILTRGRNPEKIFDAARTPKNMQAVAAKCRQLPHFSVPGTTAPRPVGADAPPLVSRPQSGSWYAPMPPRV